MSKGKKTPKLTSTADLSKWDDELIKDQLGDSEWRPCVIVVNPENCTADQQLRLLLHTASTGVRKKFTVISKELLLASAHDDVKEGAATSGGKKSKLAKNVSAGTEKPAHLVVCEHVIQALDAGEVPPSLLARMIKYKLLRARKKELANRVAAAKAAEEATKSVSAKGKGAKGGKSTPAKKGGKTGKETPAIKEAVEQMIPVPQKEPTQLKKRGEEDNAIQTIDDEPEDGPNMYFILDGFDEAEVLEHLDLVNIPVIMLVKLLAEDQELPAASEDDLEKIKIKSNRLASYWQQLHQVLQSGGDGSMLQDMSIVSLTLPLVIPSGEDDKTQYGSEGFDQLADMVYTTLDQYNTYQRYHHYTEYNKLLLLPSTTRTVSATSNSEQDQPPSRPPTPYPSSPVNVDMSYYNKLMSNIPEDHVTIELIVHCMTEQVCVTSSGEDVMARFAEPINGVEVGLSDHMTSLINGLALADHTHINGTSPNTTSHMIPNTTPTILYNGDHISQCCYGLQHVRYFDITSSAHSMAELSIFNNLLSHNISSSAMKSDQLAALRQSMEHHCVTKDITQLSFYHYLLNLCFEQLPLDPHTQSLSSPVPLLYDTPLQLGTKLSGGTVALPEAPPPQSSSSSPSRTLDVPPSLWDMTEYSVQVHYDLPVLLQVIQRLHYQYPYTVMGHHCLTDSLLVVLHSGHDGHLLQQYTHSDQLHCKVGFSNFLRYVWNKFGGDIGQATNEDEERRKVFEQQKKDDVAAVMKVIEEEQRAKAEEEQRQQQQSAKSTSGKGKATNSGKKSAVSQKSATTKQDSTEGKEEDERVTVINNRVFPERKLYVGYEVNNKVLMVDHNISLMYPLDGNQIRVHKRMVAESDQSLVVSLLSHRSILRCSLVLSDTPATTQQPSNTIGMVTSPQLPVKCATFYASLDDDELIISTSCYGPYGNGQVLVADDVTAAPATADSQQQQDGAQPSPRPTSRGQSPGRKISKKDLEQYEKQMQEQQRLAEEKREKERLEQERLRQEKLETERRQNKYLPLHITQRNGLHIHCKVVIDTDSDPSIMDGSDGQFIIRQSYGVQGDNTETQRCILSTGEVIRYLNDGVVEVLNADGKIIRTATPAELAAATSSEQLPPMESATKVTFEDTVTSPPPEQLVADNNTNIAWLVTVPTGQRYLWRKGEKKTTHPAPPPQGDGEQEEVMSPQPVATDTVQSPQLPTPPPEDDQTDSNDDLLVSLDKLDYHTATDPVTNEVLTTRVDNTLLLTRPDHTVIVEYSDGTRFTSRYNDQHQLTDWMIECRGYPCTSWDVHTRGVTLTLDNGADITCHTDGRYDINTTNGTTIKLAPTGMATYQHHPEGVSYMLDHSGTGDIISVTDQANNSFTVSSDGLASVHTEAASDDVRRLLHSSHPAQYFVINSDGNGYQLLRNDDISNVMVMAKSHPQGAVVTKGNRSTVMMPYKCSIQQSPYKEDTIIPPNLQPYTTIKCPSPPSANNNDVVKKFGANVGKGLLIGAYEPPAKPKQVTPPEAILVSQYLHYPIFDDSVRGVLYSGLADYVMWRDRQASELQALQPLDERSDVECDKASKLTSIFSSQLCHMDDSTQDYLTAINPPVMIQEEPKAPRETPQQLIDLQKEIAESCEAKRALREHDVPPYFKSAQGRKFLMSVPPDMAALSSKVPKAKPHVTFEQDNNTGVRSPSEMDLPILKEDSRLSTPATNTGVHITATTGTTGVESPTQSEIDKQVTSVSRPMNPTPSHASGQGTPTAVRPLNPTPLQAATPHGANNDNASLLSLPTGPNRPHNPTPAKAHRHVDSRESSFVEQQQPPTVAVVSSKMETMSFHHDELTDQGPAAIPSQRTLVNKSTYYNVTGDLRGQPVQLPASIKGARPGEIPNERFQAVEEPVRRKVMTSSLSQRQAARGFILLPEEVVFGVLQEGCTYDTVVTLRNTGVDTCRYKIKQPPPSTGLRIHYTPGPVAAGMKAELRVEIFAMAIGSSGSNGVGAVEHLLEITTETSVLHLPIQAIVLTADSYHNRTAIHPQGGPASNVCLLTHHPASRDDVTRPPATKPN